MDGLRYELKFEISLAAAELLKRRLRAILRRDRHAGPEGYHIRSLYFDDLESAAYREKLDGLRERSKLRLRFYNLDDSYIVLENKEKLGQMTRKTGQPVSRRTAEAMIAGEETVCQQAEGPLMKRFRALRRCGLLRPRVIVDYQRLPFIHPVSNVRVTLDMDVRTAPFQTELFRPDMATLPVLDEGSAILEVKYDAFLPTQLAAALEDVPKTRLAVSKYVKCLSILE